MAANSFPYGEKFAYPQQMVGAVILNGTHHSTLIARMRNAQNPYYSHAGGIHFDNFGNVKRGNVLFTIRGSNACASSLSFGHGFGGSGENHRVKAVAILNGLGMAGHGNNERLWESAQILGFSDGVPPTKEGLFNIVSGGVMTVTNNGPDVVNAGDWVMVYFPSLDELPTGGMGTSADANGEVVPWLVTYDPIKHSLTPKPVYEHLTADRNTPYIPIYRETCKKLMQSAKDVSLVSMAANYEKMKELIEGGASKIDFLHAMSKFMDTEKQDAKIRDMLFVPYSDKKNLIESGKSADSPLNCKQMSCMGEYMVSQSRLHHVMHDKVVGKAITTGKKRSNFSLQITSYGLK